MSRGTTLPLSPCSIPFPRLLGVSRAGCRPLIGLLHPPPNPQTQRVNTPPPHSRVEDSLLTKRTRTHTRKYQPAYSLSLDSTRAYYPHGQHRPGTFAQEPTAEQQQKQSREERTNTEAADQNFSLAPVISFFGAFGTSNSAPLGWGGLDPLKGALYRGKTQKYQPANSVSLYPPPPPQHLPSGPICHYSLRKRSKKGTAH